MTTTTMDITGVAPWYGSNRTLAEGVGVELGDLDFCVVAYAGSMCEVPWIKARSILVNDRHENVIRLARMIANPDTRRRLVSIVSPRLVHVRELTEAQERLRAALLAPASLFAVGSGPTDLQLAADYFTCVWMERSGLAGTDAELTGKLATRWDAGGGDPAKRYRSAVRSLTAWGRALKRCTFESLNAETLLERVTRASRNNAGKEPKKRERRGCYCDPPFPGPGDKYTHTIDEGGHRRLAQQLAELAAVPNERVVCRFYDHALVRELYPEAPKGPWTWVRRSGGRDAHNAEKPEVLIINGPSLAGKVAA